MQAPTASQVSPDTMSDVTARAMEALDVLCSDADASAAVMDLLLIERLIVATHPLSPESRLPETPPAAMVEVAREAHRNVGFRVTAVDRLSTTAAPALVAAFWFAQGILWRSMEADDRNNATQRSFLSLKAASEVMCSLLISINDVLVLRWPLVSHA